MNSLEELSGVGKNSKIIYPVLGDYVFTGPGMGQRVQHRLQSRKWEDRFYIASVIAYKISHICIANYGLSPDITSVSKS